MQMDTQYHPEAVTAKDDTRPALQAINIVNIPCPGIADGVDVAMSADGFMAVAVPVTLDEGDVPGLVSVEAFVQARKLAKKSKQISMVLLADKVRLSNGVELPRPSGTYPDLLRCLPDTMMPERNAQPMFALNTVYLAAIGKAMGSPALVVERFLQTGPMVMYPAEGARSERMILDVPFGVLMPFGEGKRPVDAPISLETAELEAIAA